MTAVLTDELEWTTETREHRQLAVLCCGIHEQSAVQRFERHRPDAGGGMPRVVPLEEDS